MNATLQKFGYPGNHVWKNDHWIILLRPQQVTLGALVLCTASPATSFSELTTDAATGHGAALRLIERALEIFRPYDKINFLTLMMVDPHVHTHVLPRYAGPQMFDSLEFKDTGWPATPDLKSVNEVTPPVREKLIAELISSFRSADA